MFFKFLSYKKPKFRFEITKQLFFSPANVMDYYIWGNPMADFVKEWLSEWCYSDNPQELEKTKYIPLVDRKVRIMCMGLDTIRSIQYFTATIQISADNFSSYMQVELLYPTDNPIYE